MVNDRVRLVTGTAMADAEIPGARRAERALALSYAPGSARAGIDALFALDEALGLILQTGREPLVSQMRLTWWHEALTRLDVAEPPAEPILQSLWHAVLPSGIPGARLAGMIEGWEALLEGELLDAAAWEKFADRRGAGLFSIAGALLGARAQIPLGIAGRGWALADLARHLADRTAAEAARAKAQTTLAKVANRRWPREVRVLGALTRLAMRDMAVPLDRPLPYGSPTRVARLAWHRLTGY